MKKKNCFLALVLIAALASLLGAQSQRQTGTIRGVVTDKDNTPIPGMQVTATGPALIGRVSNVTSADGAYRLPSLPPGTYTVVAELKGFKSIKQEGVVVTVGMVVAINLQTEPSALSEEIQVVATSPTVDVQSTKVGVTVSSELLQRLPLNRSLLAVFNTVAGAEGTIDTYSGAINGASDTQIPFEVDGVSSNDPAHNGLLQMPQFDTMEEIEISTGGLPAQIGNTGGGFVNIVTKSGGNDFHGQLQAFYTRSSLSQVLFTPEQMKAMSIGNPIFPIRDLDTSVFLGGPIIRDKVWFFGSAAVRDQSQPSTFIPAVLGGKSYTQYDDPQRQYETFLKLTTQISQKLRLFVMGNFRLYNRDVYVGGGTYTAYDASFTLKNNTWLQGTANLTWLLSPNTFVDIRGGYVNRWYPIKERPDTYNNVGYTDSYTGYSWSAVTSWESYITRETAQGSIRGTHFQDNLLGGDHEFGVGIEYTWNQDKYFWARHSPYRQLYYNGNPYYYRGYYNLTGPHPSYGDGRINLTLYTANNGDCGRYMDEYRIGGYIQDAWTIKNRLTINYGLRFDYYNGWPGEVTMAGVTGLRYDIGELIKPTVGFNYFGAYTIAPIKNLVTFLNVSPRIGLTYDLFGNGKTALKVSFSRYAEAVPTMWFEAASGAQMSSYTFDWWDYNNNGIPDSPLTSVDRYQPQGGDYGTLFRRDLDFLKNKVDPNLNTPQYTEVITSVKHELFRNFAVELQYLYKHGWDAHVSALYDRATQQYWYKADQVQGWWVPFQTTIPAYGIYPAQDVTVYYMSNNAPWNNQYTRNILLPNWTRNYHGVAINFDKRYADGWALGGTITYSIFKAYGAQLSSAGQNITPNSYLNAYGNDYYDQTLIVKLYGSVSLPYGFVGSFFFRHTSGTPYARNISVSPPAAWCTANNVYQSSVSILVEPYGSRRNQSYDNLDVRFEKGFNISSFKLAVFMDVYNLLGETYVTVGQNPGGTYYPANIGLNQSGTYTVASTFGKVTALAGTRTFKLSLRVQF